MCWDPQRKPTFWGFAQKQAIACRIVGKCDSLGGEKAGLAYLRQGYVPIGFVQGLCQPTNKELMQFR